MERHEIRTQIGVRNVESRTSHRLTPFTEIVKWISGDAIQGRLTANCSSGMPRLKVTSSARDETKATRETASAHARLFCGALRGRASEARNPNSGMKRTVSR